MAVTRNKGRSSMKKLFLAAATIAAFAAPAQAVTLLADDFNNEALGAPSGGLANFSITPTVDVVGPGDTFGLVCASGNCIDLIGSPGVGAITTNAVFSYVAGISYTLSIDASGSQRPDAPNAFRLAFLLDGGPASIFSDSGPIASNSPFQTYSLVFNPTTNGTFRAFVGGLGASDNQGILVDNFLLTAVPEPAAWAMMIIGFGFAGAQLRRRKPTVTVSYA
jgi:hypothetical protein